MQFLKYKSVLNYHVNQLVSRKRVDRDIYVSLEFLPPCLDTLMYHTRKIAYPKMAKMKEIRKYRVNSKKVKSTI